MSYKLITLIIFTFLPFWILNPCNYLQKNNNNNIDLTCAPTYPFLQWETQSHVFLLKNNCVLIDFIYEKFFTYILRTLWHNIFIWNKTHSCTRFKFVLGYLVNIYDSKTKGSARLLNLSHWSLCGLNLWEEIFIIFYHFKKGCFDC